MDRKKAFLILLLVMLIIVAGLIFYGKNTPKEDPAINDSLGKDKTPIATNIFSQSGEEVKIASVTGTAEKIAEKTLTIKDEKNSTIVNIHGATPVMHKQKDGTIKQGQLADLKTTDSIRVEYDIETKNVQLITIMDKK